MIGLQDLLFLIIFFVVFLCISSWLVVQFQFSFLASYPLGCLMTFSGGYVIVFAGLLLEGLLSSGIPNLPWCENGKCRGRLLGNEGDYQFVKVGENFAYRCHCGRLYAKEQQGKRFVKMDCDGTRRPYLVWKPLRGWRPDKSDSSEM